MEIGTALMSLRMGYERVAEVVGVVRKVGSVGVGWVKPGIRVGGFRCEWRGRWWGRRGVLFVDLVFWYFVGMVWCGRGEGLLHQLLGMLGSYMLFGAFSTARVRDGCEISVC